MAGRKYEDEEKAAVCLRVCRRVGEGETLAEMLAQEGIPHVTWWDWCTENEWMRSELSRARISQAHALADRAVTAARAVRGEDHHIVAAVRLEVDTIKWYTSKIAPKIYGDALQLNAGENVRIGVIALPAEAAETLPPARQLAAGDAASLGPESGSAPE